MCQQKENILLPPIVSVDLCDLKTLPHGVHLAWWMWDKPAGPES